MEAYRILVEEARNGWVATAMAPAEAGVMGEILSRRVGGNLDIVLKELGADIVKLRLKQEKAGK